MGQKNKNLRQKIKIYQFNNLGSYQSFGTKIDKNLLKIN